MTLPQNHWNMKISNKGIALIKKWEQGRKGGFASTSYICSGGKKTIGWGHVILPEDNIIEPIDDKKAEELFDRDMEEVEAIINDQVKVKLTQGQFDSLCSLVFNIGEDNFKQSTLLKFVNKELFDKVPTQFLRWVYSRKKLLPGLKNRRNDEVKLWQNIN